jgi:hypothetical protein
MGSRSVSPKIPSFSFRITVADVLLVSMKVPPVRHLALVGPQATGLMPQTSHLAGVLPHQ